MLRDGRLGEREDLDEVARQAGAMLRQFAQDAHARRIPKGTERDSGAKCLGLLIGGPDGHGEAVLSAARLKLSFGAMTLPHGLARVVLTEQLYRAATILSGHPYHRA